jgi:N4-bis(aminopropyl)spermidine synthase
VFEAVLPGFNAYHGAQAIGSRAALYVLRPTKRSRKIAARRATRHALYTRGRQAVEARATDVPDLGELEGDDAGAYFGGAWRPLTELLDAPQDAETVYVDLTPDLVYSLYQVAAAVSAPRALIVAHNRTEGLRTAEEQARLRAVAAPREVVRMARSWRESPYTLVELSGPAGRDEARVYRAAATSISIARVASGAPQSSSDAGVATP